jgi:hypothetical protein
VKINTGSVKFILARAPNEKVKVKISLLQAVEAHRVVRG